MATKRELEARIAELEEALEETRSLIDEVLGIEEHEDDSVGEAEGEDLDEEG